VNPFETAYKMISTVRTGLSSITDFDEVTDETRSRIADWLVDLGQVQLILVPMKSLANGEATWTETAVKIFAMRDERIINRTAKLLYNLYPHAEQSELTNLEIVDPGTGAHQQLSIGIAHDDGPVDLWLPRGAGIKLTESARCTACSEVYRWYLLENKVPLTDVVELSVRGHNVGTCTHSSDPAIVGEDGLFSLAASNVHTYVKRSYD
jgi:hypothetical protein